MKTNLVKHLPTILTVGASIGVIAVGALSSLAYPKAKKTYDDILKDQEKTRGNKAKAVLKASKHYIVPAIITAITITSIVEANILNKKEKTLLLSSYIGLQEYVKTYRDKVAERYSPEVEKEIHEEVQHEVYRRYNYHCIDQEFPDRKCLWYEPMTKQKFWRYEREIIDAELHINHNFVMGGCMSLNDYLGMFGFDTIGEAGEEKGWASCDLEEPWLEFEHRLGEDDEGNECYVIWPLFAPLEDYRREWE